MPPKFGTSGLRGLVTELTPDLVASYVRAFVAACPQGSAVHVGWDLRPSSPAIADVVQTVQACGLTAVRCGEVPTPALALAAMNAGCGAVMVTGSHIPADRNGLKFYVPSGEVSKEDETQILAALDALPDLPERKGTQEDHPTCAADYVARYTDAFGDQALAGMRIGVYQHSSVARDIMVAVVQGCGGTPVPAGPGPDTFHFPSNTESGSNPEHPAQQLGRHGCPQTTGLGTPLDFSTRTGEPPNPAPNALGPNALLGATHSGGPGGRLCAGGPSFLKEAPWRGACGGGPQNLCPCLAHTPRGVIPPPPNFLPIWKSRGAP